MKKVKCPTCKGVGKVIIVHRVNLNIPVAEFDFGFAKARMYERKKGKVNQPILCPDCGGTGKK